MSNPSEGGSYVRHEDGTLERREFTLPAGANSASEESEAAQGRAALGDDPSKPETPSGEATAQRRRGRA